MRSEMKMHVETVHEKVNEKKLWKAKLKEKEIEVCSQKFKISSEIFSLKEKEISLNESSSPSAVMLFSYIEYNLLV